MDYRGTCLLTLTLILHLKIHSLSGGLTEVAPRCCEIGKQWFTTNRETCTAYTAPILGVAPKDRSLCRSLIDLCCLTQRNQRQCSAGKMTARLRRSCEALSSRPGSEDARECCHCCYMGATAAESGLSCHSLISKYGRRCDEVILECCNSTVSRNHLNVVVVDESVATITTTLVSTTAEDICARFPGQLCAQICISTPGSYLCSCNPGFVLQPDRRTCNLEVLDRCLASNPCQHRCVDKKSHIECSCYDGFTLNPDEKTCKDLDECLDTNKCGRNENCLNTIGSFQCQPQQPQQTHHPQHVTDNGNVRDNSFGDSYQYRGNGRCGIGFYFNEDLQTCEDINECALSRDNCMEGQTCENTIGSFYCRRTIGCGTGYTLEQTTQECIDDDECRLGTHNCGPTRDCNNIPGSFRCTTKECPFGYKLDTRSGFCEVVNCASGLKPDVYGNCIDIDECGSESPICRSNQECRNTVGSYNCVDILVCESGYELNSEGSSCDDIDECSTGNNDCTGGLTLCVNKPGTYVCQCPPGLQLNQVFKYCEDIDECRTNPDSCASNAKCENTHGSFRCICKEGFLQSGDHCIDFDECSQADMCQQTCHNTWGSYQCTCMKGYKTAADGRMCDDIDECKQAAENNFQLCYGICENTHGSFTCVCPIGFQMSGDGQTCQDIDECAMRTAHCNQGGDDMCINTRGSYKCQSVSCPRGFVKAPSIPNRNTNVKCQRKSLLCPQGDIDCLYAPLSYSINFITFPTKIRVPADLFTMRGPLSPYRRLTYDLKIIKSIDPTTGLSHPNQGIFNIHQPRDNEAVIQLLQQVEGPQDIELQLDMNIYSREFRQNEDEVFFGTAVAKIFVYVTKEEW